MVAQINTNQLLHCCGQFLAACACQERDLFALSMTPLNLTRAQAKGRHPRTRELDMDDLNSSVDGVGATLFKHCYRNGLRVRKVQGLHCVFTFPLLLDSYFITFLHRGEGWWKNERLVLRNCFFSVSILCFFSTAALPMAWVDAQLLASMGLPPGFVMPGMAVNNFKCTKCKGEKYTRLMRREEIRVIDSKFYFVTEAEECTRCKATGIDPNCNKCKNTGYVDLGPGLVQNYDRGGRYEQHCTRRVECSDCRRAEQFRPTAWLIQ